MLPLIYQNETIMLPASITERAIEKMINGMSFEDAIKYAFEEEEKLINWLIESNDAKPVKNAIAERTFIKIHTNQFNKKYSS